MGKLARANREARERRATRPTPQQAVPHLQVVTSKRDTFSETVEEIVKKANVTLDQFPFLSRDEVVRRANQAHDDLPTLFVAGKDPIPDFRKHRER